MTAPEDAEAMDFTFNGRVVVSVAEAAAATGLSQQTIRRQLRIGGIEGAKAEGRCSVDLESALAYARELRRPGPDRRLEEGRIVNIQLSHSTLAALTAQAARTGTSRADVIRSALASAATAWGAR